MNANVKVNENLEAGTGRLGLLRRRLRRPGQGFRTDGGSLKFEPDASAYFAGGYEGQGKVSVPMGGSLKFEPDALARRPYLRGAD